MPELSTQPPRVTPPHQRPRDVAPTLLSRLADALAAEEISYCQWKGHWKQERWATGRGDIDLLVRHSDRSRFRGVLDRLRFVPALPPPGGQLPGVESYFGFDPALARLIHLHVHYRLILGAPWATTYRLPIEEPLLASAVDGPLFRIPAAELELVLFVLRMLQRESLRHALRHDPRRWLAAIQPELRYLYARVDPALVHAALARHLPCLEPAFFDRCLASLQPGASRWRRIARRRELRARLRAYARRPAFGAVLAAGIGSRRRSPASRMRPAAGGTVIALVGGDGAGKSTCATALRAWLSQAFPVLHVHLGKPPRSLATLAVGGALRLRQRWAGSRRPGYLELLRHLCTARDRYRLYEKAQRFAVAGGIAICERYPLSENRLHAGPCIGRLLGSAPAGRLRAALRDAEERYYARILPPDLVLVLRVDPEVAVRRKTTEPADYVRARAEMIWGTDWTSARARLVDADRPLPEVLAELQAVVWSEV